MTDGLTFKKKIFFAKNILLTRPLVDGANYDPTSRYLPEKKNKGDLQVTIIHLQGESVSMSLWMSVLNPAQMYIVFLEFWHWLWGIHGLIICPFENKNNVDYSNIILAFKMQIPNYV